MYICLINKFDTMKRLLSLLAPVAAALVLLTVSCKNDKAPAANSAEMDAFLREAPYLNHLPDEAEVLLSFHPLQLLDKSGFATDEEFAPLRDQILGDMDVSTKIAALAALKDPSLAGLDPAHPLVVAITDIEVEREDVKADICGVLPLTNRELFVTLLNKADTGLTPEEDGNYRINDKDFSLAILPEAVLFYGQLNRDLGRSAVAAKMDAMIAKKSLYVGSHLAESVLMGGDDLTLLASDKTADLYVQILNQQLGTDVVKLLGGNPFENLNSLLRLNCRRGELLAESIVEGSNPLYKRYSGWLGTPDKADLEWLPSFVAVAGQLALQNVPDLLDYAQEVLDRSGEADGVVLADVIKAVGIEKKDLNEVGTITFGYVYNDGRSDDFLVVAKAGEKIASTLDGMLDQLGTDRDPDTGFMHVSGNLCVTFKEDYAILATGGMISRSTGSFTEDKPSLAHLLKGNSVVADLALGFHLPYVNHAVLTIDIPTATLEVATTEPDENAAKTLLKALVDYLESNVFAASDFDEAAFYDPEFDEDFDAEFDYLY